MKDCAPGLELPNNMLEGNYPQSFVQSKTFPSGTKNESPKQAPSLDEVIHGFTKYPCY